MVNLTVFDHLGYFWAHLVPFGPFQTRVEEVVRRHEGPSPKSLDSDENFKPSHTLFCRNIKICCDLLSLWKTLGKNSVSWAKSAL